MSTAVVFGSRCHMSLHMLYQVCIAKPASHNWIEPAKWRWQAGYATWNECGQRAHFEFLITYNHYSWPVRLHHPTPRSQWEGDEACTREGKIKVPQKRGGMNNIKEYRYVMQ